MPTIRSPRSLVSVLCALMLVWASLPCVPLQAQEQSLPGWDSVLRLRVGEGVVIATDSAKFQGVVEQVDPDSVSMTTRDKQHLLFPREKVKSVGYQGKHAKLGGALLVGGIALAVAGLVIDTGSDLKSLSSGSLPENHNMALSIVGIGISVAGVFTLIKGGARTIYQRPERGGKPSEK